MSWNTSPMLRRTSSRWRTTSNPATVAEPAVGIASVHSMLIVVVLPAPFGPRNPKVSPRKTSNSTPATATRSPNRFSSPRTEMTESGVAAPVSPRRPTPGSSGLASEPWV